MKKNEHKTEKHEEMFFSERAFEYGRNPQHYGDLDCPDGHARVTGPCGDTNEIYLRIREGRIQEAKFMTDGCLYSLAACNAAAHLAIGKTLHQCYSINQHSILEHLKGLPADHAHCALLAATTLYQAVSDYVTNYNASPAVKPKPQKKGLTSPEKRNLNDKSHP